MRVNIQNMVPWRFHKPCTPRLNDTTPEMQSIMKSIQHTGAHSYKETKVLVNGITKVVWRCNCGKVLS